MSANAVIYRRQSADRLNDELGIERQLKVCQGVAERRGLNVTQVLTDNNLTASKKDNRPAYKQLTELMRTGQVDVVIILRVDRLLRLNDELEELIQLVEQHPVTVITAEGEVDLSTPQGRLIARILVSVARNEAEVKASRHKLANQQKAAQGLPHASYRPFGYEADRVTVRESEAALLRDMARRLMQGQTYKEVAAWANSTGITTSRGKSWYPRTVRQILEFKRYAGIREYEGVDYPAVWPAIFDAETWERLQLTIRLRAEANSSSTKVGRKYLLTGLLFCGVCGNAMVGGSKRDRPNRPLRTVYHCRYPGYRDNVTCGSLQRGAVPLEHFVTEVVLRRLDTPRLDDLMREARGDTTLGVLLDKRNAIQLRLDAIMDDYGTGELTKAQMTRAKAAATTELEKVTKELERAAGKLNSVRLPSDTSVREAWAATDSLSWRRGIISLIVERVEVLPSASKPWYMIGEQRYKFEPDAVRIVWKA